MKKARPYHSPARKKQAEATRARIAAGARKLLIRKGFAGTTVEEIAREAGVSVPTVYAVFGSKEGIVAGLINAARFGEEYERVVGRAHETRTGPDRLRAVAAIARQVYELERAEVDLLRGAGVVSPVLAAAEKEAQDRRFAGQIKNAEFLIERGELRSDLDRHSAAEILWTLTSRDLYRLTVIERGWPPARYESWLGEMLINALIVRRRRDTRSARR